MPEKTKKKEMIFIKKYILIKRDIKVKLQFVFYEYMTGRKLRLSTLLIDNCDVFVAENKKIKFIKEKISLQQTPN